MKRMNFVIRTIAVISVTLLSLNFVAATSDSHDDGEIVGQVLLKSGTFNARKDNFYNDDINAYPTIGAQILNIDPKKDSQRSDIGDLSRSSKDISVEPSLNFDINEYEWFKSETFTDAKQYIVTFSEEALIYGEQALLATLYDKGRGFIITYIPHSSYHIVASNMTIMDFARDLRTYVWYVGNERGAINLQWEKEHVSINKFSSEMKISPELALLRERQRLLRSGRRMVDLISVETLQSLDKEQLSRFALDDGVTYNGADSGILLPSIENLAIDESGRVGVTLSILDLVVDGRKVDMVDFESVQKAISDLLLSEEQEFTIEVFEDSTIALFLDIGDNNDLSYTIRLLSTLPFITWIEPRLNIKITNSIATTIVQSGETVPLLSNRPIWAASITGDGQRVGTGDTGVDMQHCFFTDEVESKNEVIYDRGDISHRKVISYRTIQDNLDANGHGTHTAGTIAGLALGDDENNPRRNGGICPSCKLVISDIGRGESGSLSIPRMGFDSYFGYAQRYGAYIHSDSWGTGSTQYSRLSQSIDSFCWYNEDFLPVFSAGNEGVLLQEQTTVSDPALAKNALAVGATLSSNSQRPLGYGESFDIIVNGNSKPTLSEEFLYSRKFRLLRGTFGARLRVTSGNSYNRLVIGNPIEGCSPLINSEDVRDNVVLLERGDCMFTEKARAAEEAGAKMVIIFNNEESGYFKMSAPDDSNEVSIPTLATTRSVGRRLSDLIKRETSWSIDFIIRVAPATSSRHDNIATFSSFGPTRDGRIKPDIVAPGDRIVSASITSRRSGSCGTASYSGTSMAAPAVAGAAALVRQYFMDGFYPNGIASNATSITPSAALIRAVMLNGAQSMNGYTDIGTPLEPAPSFRQGFGMLRLDKSLYLASENDSLKLFVEDRKDVLSGESMSYCVTVDESDDIDLFRATVAWQDPPASLSSIKTLVNNIDLNVYTYDGDNLISIVASTDDLNNVERVVLINPESTELKRSKYKFIVEVKGKTIPVRKNRYANVGQPFALAMTGKNLSVEFITPSVTCKISTESNDNVQDGGDSINDGIDDTVPNNVQDDDGVLVDSGEKKCRCTIENRSNGVEVNLNGCSKGNPLSSSDIVELNYCYVFSSDACSELGITTFASSEFNGARWKFCRDEDEDVVVEEENSEENLKESDCTCTSTGISGSVSTGRIGCVPEPSDPSRKFCYVQSPDLCEEATSSTVFRGAAWREC